MINPDYEVNCLSFCSIPAMKCRAFLALGSLGLVIAPNPGIGLARPAMPRPREWPTSS